MGLVVCTAGCCPGCDICCGVGAGCHADPCTCAKPPPVRVQQRREKGWRKPEGAMSVTRSTRFGNRFVVSEPVRARGRKPYWLVTLDGGDRVYGPKFFSKLDAVREAVALHHDHIGTFGLCEISDDDWTLLRGRDLMCYCPLWTPDGDRHPCHADTLLRYANPDVVFPWAPPD